MWLASGALTAQIHVNLFNDARMDQSTIGAGSREAHRILRLAGVKSTWFDCRAEPCVARGKQYLQLRLYAAESELVMRFAPDVYAFALPAAPPECGFFAGALLTRS